MLLCRVGDERRLGQLGLQTFDEIWHGEAFQAFRRDLLDGTTTPGICRICTITPLGPHPFPAWAASLVPGSIQVTRGRGAAVRIQIRNEGTRTWTRGDLVRIGTHAPRDGVSALEHHTWLAPTRAATFDEDVIEPGGIATFRFLTNAPPDGVATGAFQVVVDGVRWLPNTQFTVTTRAERPMVRRRAIHVIDRLAGPHAAAWARRVATRCRIR